jgi:hypothetical protein
VSANGVPDTPDLCIQANLAQAKAENTPPRDSDVAPGFELSWAYEAAADESCAVLECLRRSARQAASSSSW